MRGCLERFAAAGETATHTVADGEQDGFVGTWGGEGEEQDQDRNPRRVDRRRRPSGGAVLLDTQGRVDDRAFDAGAGAAVQSGLEDGRLLAVRGKHSYGLVASGEDKVRHTYRRNGKDPRHTTLKRTTPSGCLARVRLREEPA